MPLPLAPVAVIALRVSAVALTTWAAKRALTRAMQPGRRDQHLEDALDALPEGLTRHSTPSDATERGTARLERRFRIGRTEWHLDAAIIARLRLKKV